MKRSQIILFVIFIVISGSIFWRLKSNQKVQSKTLKEENKSISVPVQEVNNKPHLVQLISYGQVAPNMNLSVAFEVQGKLEKGDLNMKPGTNFKAGQVLYRINHTDAWFNLEAKKAVISNKILALLPDIELDFPSEKSKWIKFINDLNPNQKDLPRIPKINSVKEEMFFIGRNFFAEYYSLEQLQFQLQKYLFTAPFDGTVLEIFAEPGSIINPGVQIAKIAKTGDYEVKVPVAIEDLDLYEGENSADFTDPSGKHVGTGSILRISNVINQQTQSADVYYSIKPVEGEKIYNGMFVNVSINQESMKQTVVLPRTALMGTKVYVLMNDKIKSIEVNVVNSVPDSIYVTGLKNGQIVILEQLGIIDSKAKYIGESR